MTKIKTIRDNSGTDYDGTIDEPFRQRRVFEPKNKIRFLGTTKTWRDKINGQTYFSTNVEDIERDVNYLFPITNGYGDQSEYNVKRALEIDDSEIRFIKIPNCKKSEVKEHGQGQKENYFSDLGYYYQD